MRQRDIFYLALMVLVGFAPVALAAPVASWGPAWQQTVPAGGPVSLSRALLTISPGGQTVVVDLPGTLKQTRVSWPAGTRKAALRAAVLAADHGAAIALGERCAGELLTVYSRAPDLVPSAQPAQSAPLATHVVPKKLATAVQRAPAVAQVWLIPKGERMSVALAQLGGRTRVDGRLEVETARSSLACARLCGDPRHVPVGGRAVGEFGDCQWSPDPAHRVPRQQHLSGGVNRTGTTTDSRYAQNQTHSSYRHRARL